MGKCQTINVIKNGMFSFSQLSILLGVDKSLLETAFRENNFDLNDSLTFNQATKVSEHFFETNQKSKVVMFTHQKGGIGKTTFCYQFSQLLQLRGNKKVLVIDLDGQKNLTKYYVRGDSELSLYNYFSVQKRSSLKNIKIDIDENLSIIPSNTSMARFLVTIDNLLHTNKNGEICEDPNFKAFDQFKKDFADLVKKYDYVLIDTPPNISSVTLLFFIVSNIVIVPCEPERNSIDGAGEILDFRDFSLEFGTNGADLKYFLNERSPIDKEVYSVTKKALHEILESENATLLNTEFKFNKIFSSANLDGVPFWFCNIKNPTEDDIALLKDFVYKFTALLDESLGEDKKKDKEKSTTNLLKAVWG